VHGAFLLFAVALVGRAAWVQLGETDEWRARARGQQVATSEIPAFRGPILDASGATLVASRELVRLDVAPNEVRDVASLRAALLRIGLPREAVARATDRKRKWVELPGRFLNTEVADLMAMRGVHPRRTTERVPPATDGLRRLLGVVDAEGDAIGGVESALDSLLRGTAGRSALRRDGRGGRFSTPEEERQDAVRGHDVVLTLHEGLQGIVERALADAVMRMGASGGDIVVLEPHTGEIRALASRRPVANSTGATALTEPYEPGSTLKPFLAAALFERGLARLDEIVPTFNGAHSFDGRVIRDVHKADRMTFADVIRFSSNIGMVQFAARLTPREEYETLRDAGFGMTTGLPYPSESPGRLYPVKEWSRLSPASLAMGYEISVTPVQLAAAYAAFANGGVLLQPTLVKEVRAPDGRIVWRSEPRAVRRLMSEETSLKMRALLRDVVTEGTATTADLATFELAGKSGTARRTSTDGRGYEPGAYTASFVGLFPADAPQLVILVKLDNPTGQYYGGRTAAPLTKVVLEAAIAARDGALDRRQLAAAPRRRDTLRAALADTVRATTDSDERASDTRSAFVVDLGEPTEPTRRVVSDRVVPDVRGMDTREAVRALHRAGFRVRLVPGSGAATAPSAGAVLRTGSLVQLAAGR
jgi:cell division protein FtsI (penicillin-binding protein 3)